MVRSRPHQTLLFSGHLRVPEGPGPRLGNAISPEAFLPCMGTSHPLRMPPAAPRSHIQRQQQQIKVLVEPRTQITLSPLVSSSRYRLPQWLNLFALTTSRGRGFTVRSSLAPHCLPQRLCSITPQPFRCRFSCCSLSCTVGSGHFVAGTTTSSIERVKVLLQTRGELRVLSQPAGHGRALAPGMGAGPSRLQHWDEEGLHQLSQNHLK